MGEANPPALQQYPTEEDVNVVPAPQQDPVEDGDGDDDNVLPVLQQP